MNSNTTPSPDPITNSTPTPPAQDLKIEDAASKAATPKTTANPAPIKPIPVSKPNTPAPTTKSSGKIISIAIGLVVIIILAIGGYYLLKSQQQKQANDIAGKNKAIQSAVYELRRQTDKYYEDNKTYMNWQGNAYLENEVAGYGSKLNLQMPDFQTYVIYAKILESNKYFCVDSKGFAGEIDFEPSERMCGN